MCPENQRLKRLVLKVQAAVKLTLKLQVCTRQMGDKIINFKLLGYNATTPLIQPMTTNRVRINYLRVLLRAFQFVQ
jgi:hypothetical protein